MALDYLSITPEPAIPSVNSKNMKQIERGKDSTDRKVRGRSEERIGILEDGGGTGVAGLMGINCMW